MEGNLSQYQEIGEWKTRTQQRGKRSHPGNLSHPSVRAPSKAATHTEPPGLSHLLLLNVPGLLTSGPAMDSLGYGSPVAHCHSACTVSTVRSTSRMAAPCRMPVIQDAWLCGSCRAHIFVSSWHPSIKAPPLLPPICLSSLRHQPKDKLPSGFRPFLNS